MLLDYRSGLFEQGIRLDGRSLCTEPGLSDGLTQFDAIDHLCDETQLSGTASMHGEGQPEGLAVLACLSLLCCHLEEIPWGRLGDGRVTGKSGSGGSGP